MSAGPTTLEEGGAPGAAAERRGLTADQTLATLPGPLSRTALIGWGLAVAIGVAGFVIGVADAPRRAWQITLANFLFWTALAQAGIVFGAALRTAGGHWGKDFRRVAEGMGAFLPASLLIFCLLWFGAEHIFPWTEPLEGHVNLDWLTRDGVFLRNGVGLLVLYLLSFAFLRVSLRADAPLIRERVSGWRARLMGWIGRGWRGDEAELARSRRLLGRMSPALILVWVAVFTLLSIDLVMSLMPGFYSVIWGAHYFIGGWLSMLALVAILSAFQGRRHDLSPVWGKWEYHDLGKLLFAFVIFWTYFWWSQYFVIWYGNLGRETIFFEQRLAGGFGPLYVLQMVLIFALPFLLLLGRRPKMRPWWLAGVSVLILAGLWLERFLLVVPSTWQGEGVPLGLLEVAISLGFLGLFGLCYALWSSVVPRLPIRETLVGRAGHGP